MSDQFVAEVRAFSFSYAPTGWALCDGGLLPIAQNNGLWVLLQTNYGGDGTTNFGLPNLAGSIPVHPDGQSSYFATVGMAGGSATSTLQQSQMATHTHALGAADVVGENAQPTGNVLARFSTATQAYQTSASGLTPMASQTLPAAGDGGAHPNLMPYTTLSFCIALEGIFPQRG